LVAKEKIPFSEMKPVFLLMSKRNTMMNVANLLLPKLMFINVCDFSHEDGMFHPSLKTKSLGFGVLLDFQAIIFW
jgi:hypothetical protein